MLQELKDTNREGLSAIKEIERCFQICYTYWSQIRRQVIGFHFKQIEEEIRFFKTLKPLFTSQMEYYNLLYYVQVFQPQQGEEERTLFSQREKERLPRFIETNKEFYAYYKKGCTHLDRKYFVRPPGTTNTAPAPGHDGDDQTATSHDPLITTLLSLEKFLQYLQKTHP